MLCHRVMTTLEADVPPFQVEPITVGDCAVLRVAGEVDVYTAPELRQQLIKLVDSGAWHVVADLAGVDFLDSSGLGVLVGFGNEIEESHRAFQIDHEEKCGKRNEHQRTSGGDS